MRRLREVNSDLLLIDSESIGKWSRCALVTDQPEANALARDSTFATLLVLVSHHQKWAEFAVPLAAQAAGPCMSAVPESAVPAGSGCQPAAAELAAAGTGKAVPLAAEALRVCTRGDTVARAQAGERPPAVASTPAEHLDTEDAIDTVAEARIAVATGTAAVGRIAVEADAEAAVNTVSPPAGSGSRMVVAAVRSSDRAAAIAVAEPSADASGSVESTSFRTSTANSRRSWDTD